VTPAELAAIKGTLGRSLLLYLGDYCPVGCSHCSVDARADAPRTDPDQVRRVCSAINHLSGVDVVGISGGEPLADRVALLAAIETLAPELRLVLYTSGLPWITDKRPAWITRLLPRFEACVLSVSSFHASALGREDYVDDVIAVLLESGIDVHLHVLDVPSELSRARELAERFRASEQVWISPIPFLSRGRAQRFGLVRRRLQIATVGTCQAVVTGRAC
jgi:organic radical activating enzyme